ncbi:MAG: nuclear transport factor 2 family protein [Pseudomonadales bacterium]|nr:nuclear transport factor 2 family protein [Pseudomonadales bacterium]
MTDLEKLAARLDRLESKDAIRNLVTAYAIACDEHDIPRLADLFTEDADFGSPNGKMVSSGREAIREMFINTFRIRGPAFHWTHDVTVTIDAGDPDRATGLVYSHAETTPNGVVSIAAMKYHDTYRREAGVWRIASRQIQFLYYVPYAKYGEALTSTNRVLMGGDLIPADYPESLPAWQEYARTHLS